MMQRFAMMQGNSAPLLNRKMSHELPQIIGVKAKPRPPLTNRKPPRRKKRRQDANAERMETHWWAPWQMVGYSGGGFLILFEHGGFGKYPENQR
jgi:hypothetical protein